MRHIVSIIGLALLLLACTSGPYEKAIVEFSSATDTADAAMAMFATQLEERERERRLAFAVTHPSQLVDIGVSVQDTGSDLENLVVSDNQAGCTSADVSCLLVLKNIDGAPVELDPGPQLTQIRGLVDEIQAYAANLKAVAEADSRQRVEGAIDSASGNVKKIAGLLGHAAPVSISAVGDLTKWIAGAYLDSLKINALRKATTAGEEAMGETSEFLSAVSRLSADAIRFVEFGPYADARQRFVIGGSRSRKDIERWEAARQQFDRVLKMKSGAVFEELRESHHALYEALQRPELTFENAIVQIQKYKKSAEELFEILDKLNKGLSEEA